MNSHLQAKDKKEQLWLLQARPLIIATKTETNEAQFESLKLIEQKIQQGLKSHPFLMGKRTVWGIMPDWNPAEIIGVRPKPLALSLYRDLITDSIWAYQRHNYGYRNLRSFPLMSHFLGLPYIDVRVSFNSFVPADLDENSPIDWLIITSIVYFQNPIFTIKSSLRSYFPVTHSILKIA